MRVVFLCFFNLKNVFVLMFVSLSFFAGEIIV